MRNGNKQFDNYYILCFLVLILPMRNGNRNTVVVRSFKNKVLILPMRNGNMEYIKQLMSI